MKKTTLRISVFIVTIFLSIILIGCSSKSSPNKTSCGDPILDTTKKYAVEFQTTKGNFTIGLDAKTYPISTSHLAALVQNKFYDGLTFHRVVKDFVIQGGDPNGDGSGSSACSVVSEKPKHDYKQGDFAWAKTANDPAGTAGSQFFIITGGPTSQNVAFLNNKTEDIDGKLKLSYGYAGKVTKGLDVVLAIESLAPEEMDGPPTETVTIEKAILTSS